MSLNKAQSCNGAEEAITVLTGTRQPGSLAIPWSGIGDTGMQVKLALAGQVKPPHCLRSPLIIECVELIPGC
jgi:hypothetical protein